jgi:hypothetical protein
MLKQYYYNQQLKKATIVFANIFANLKVRTGKNACGDIEELTVPIRYGSADRVAAAIAAGNTQNKLHTLPIMSCYMTGIELAPERKHGHGTFDRKSYLEQGGTFPDDVKFIKRLMPTPYNLTYELSIYASNTDQAYQIIEQIMIVFDYDMQVQFNDSPFDWAKITRVTLESIGNEENYPAGTDRRIIVWNLSFMFETWISPPAEVKQGLINNIVLNFANMDDPEKGCKIFEVGEDGELAPFDPEQEIGQVVIAGEAGELDPPDDVPECDLPERYNPSLDPECHQQPPAKP